MVDYDNYRFRSEEKAKYVKKKKKILIAYFVTRKQIIKT